MKNVEPRKNKNDALMDWADAPLFNQNVAPQIINAAPQISNLIPEEKINDGSPEEFNVEPHYLMPAPEKNSSVVNAIILAKENVDLHKEEQIESYQKTNVEPHLKENTDLSISEKNFRKKKLRKKRADKKILSQKRSVIPLKFFVSPAEKIEMENKAKQSGWSLSNFIRLNLGLAFNEIGRKKQNIKPAFDLDDLDLED